MAEIPQKGRKNARKAAPLVQLRGRVAGKVLAWALVLAAALAVCSVALVVLWSLELPPPTAEVEVEIPVSRFAQ